MQRTTGHRGTRLAGLITLGLALTACASVTDVLPSRSASPSATTTAPACWNSPVTGTCAEPTDPVIVVKIDDVSAARPQFHLNQADVVIVEPVEGGLTRLFAVYHSQRPPTVGPIRSARITDTDLVAMLGEPGFAYSGSMSRLVPYLQRASMQLIGAPQGGSGYRRLSDRPAPHNYVADVAALIERLDDPGAAQLKASAYWKLAEKRPALGTAVTAVTATWPAARKDFIWDAERSVWNLSIFETKLLTQIDDAGTTERARATNIVVSETTLLDSSEFDTSHSRTPYPQTYGTGSGLVLVDGRAIEAQWRREAKTDFPRWFTLTGEEIALAPGNTWWLLVDDLSQVKLRTAATPSPSNSSTASTKSA